MYIYTEYTKHHSSEASNYFFKNHHMQKHSEIAYKQMYQSNDKSIKIEAGCDEY